MLKQNDRRLFELGRGMYWDKETGRSEVVSPVWKWGCLFVSIGYEVERLTEQFIGDWHIKEAYKSLTERNEENRWWGMRKDCFVLNHEDVWNAFYDVLGIRYHFEVKYAKRASLEAHTGFLEVPTEYDSLILEFEYMRADGTFGKSHFMPSCGWNPWAGKMELTHLKSLRFYDVGEEK